MMVDVMLTQTFLICQNNRRTKLGAATLIIYLEYHSFSTFETMKPLAL